MKIDKAIKIGLVCLAIGGFMFESAMAGDFLDNQISAKQEQIISRMSGFAMLKLAEKQGIVSIENKDLTGALSPSKGGPSPIALADRPVGTDPTIHENEPSIAVKPNNANTVVAASHLIGDPSGKCGAFRSADKGETWTGPVLLPLRFATDLCSDPVVRWSPDSSHVFAAYMSIRGDFSTADIVVTRSTNNGATWAAPKVAIAGGDLDGDGFMDFPDKPWLDVHTFAAASNSVYVTTTIFDNDGDIHIRFARSINDATSFLAPLVLADATAASGVVIQGSRPIGGRGNVVLACWYNSETDGWGPAAGGGGVFDIRCKRSGDAGVSFGVELVAVNDKSFENSFWLGPFAAYHRWWGGMFPSLMITNDGVAHMVFTADPVAGEGTAEAGDVFYVRSPNPYSSWSAPQRLNDPSSRAQGYPTITAKRITGGSILAAFWEDHRNAPVDNEIYDTFSDHTLPAFGPDILVTDIPSQSDFIFIGDYIDSSTSKVVSDRTAHVIWTDRSDKTDIFDFEDDVYSDLLELVP